MINIIKELQKGCGQQLSVNMFRFDYCKENNLCSSCKRALFLIKGEMKDDS